MTDDKRRPQPANDPGNDTAPISVVRPRAWGNAPVVVVAVLVGVLCGGPHCLMAMRAAAQGKVYAPQVVQDVSALTADETTYYAPRIREVLDGHLLSADPDGLEHKDSTPFLGQAWLDCLAAGALGFIANRSVPNVFILCDFLLPPFCFLVLFAICRRLGAPQWVSIAASLVSVLAHDQVTLPIAFAANPSWDMISERLHLVSSARPVEFCRLTVPQLAFIPCAGAILGLITLHYHPRPRRAIFTGVLLGLLFYCYVFYWTFVLAGGALLVASGLVMRQGRRGIPMILAALAIGVLVGLPVIYQAIMPEGFAGKEELLARQSWGGRHIRWGFQKHDLALLAALLLLYPKRRREFVPLTAFLLAPFACIFGARVVGMNTQEWHWLGRCWQPWSALTAVMMLWAWIAAIQERRSARAQAQTPELLHGARRADVGLSIVFGALAVLALAYTANDHCRFSQDMASSYTISSELHQALTELNLRTEKDSVVMCLDANMLALIPVYTHCNVYLPYCIVSPIPTDELIDRAAVTFGAYGLDEAAMSKLLQGTKGKSDKDIALNRDYESNLANWLFHQTLPTGGTPPEAEKTIKTRALFYGAGALEETRSRYRVDFIWWGPFERRVADKRLEPRDTSRLFIEAGGLRVYRAEAGTKAMNGE